MLPTRFPFTHDAARADRAGIHDTPTARPGSSCATLLVLAAGLGTRFGSLKQLAALGPLGETILDYSVFDAMRAGFRRIVFVIREEFSDQFQSQVVARYAKHVEVICVFQDLHDVPAGYAVPAGRTKPWGTIHAILAARHVLDSFFTVINADDFYGRDAYLHMMAHYQQWADSGCPSHHCAMVAYPLQGTLSCHGGVNRGICKVQDGLLTGIEEVTDIQAALDGSYRGYGFAQEPIALPAQSLVSMNFWGLTPAVLPKMSDHFNKFLAFHSNNLSAECYIPTFVASLIQSQPWQCRVLPGGSDWFGVTYPQDSAWCASRLRQLIDADIYPSILWRGCPASTDQ